MQGKVLFHGTTERRYSRHAQSPDIPPLWTTGPVQALQYSTVFSMDDRSKMLILALPTWKPSDFEHRGIEEGNFNIPGFWDYETRSWYGLLSNPFPTMEKRDAALELWPESRLEEFLSKYAPHWREQKALVDWLNYRNSR
jgi:hypothetical protein